MVYIDRNGRVCEQRPWDLNRVMEVFAGLWVMITYFFKTLFAPFMRDSNDSGGRDSRRSGWSSGSGGGGGGGGGGGSGGTNGGPRPNRRIGRITNAMDCNIPGGG